MLWIDLFSALLGLTPDQAPPVAVRITPQAVQAHPERIIGTYGNWTVSDTGDFTAAYTANESGSIFGVLCGTTCVYYLNVRRRCGHGESYPAMISSAAGASSLQLRCYRIDNSLHVLTMPDNDYYVDMLTRGGEVGFAVPIDGVRFSVSRFSLTGGLDAATLAASLVERRRNESQDGLRDFTI